MHKPLVLQNAFSHKLSAFCSLSAGPDLKCSRKLHFMHTLFAKSHRKKCFNVGNTFQVLQINNVIVKLVLKNAYSA